MVGDWEAGGGGVDGGGVEDAFGRRHVIGLELGRGIGFRVGFRCTVGDWCGGGGGGLDEDGVRLAQAVPALRHADGLGAGLPRLDGVGERGQGGGDGVGVDEEGVPLVEEVGEHVAERGEVLHGAHDRRERLIGGRKGRRRDRLIGGGGRKGRRRRRRHWKGELEEFAVQAATPSRGTPTNGELTHTRVRYVQISQFYTCRFSLEISFVQPFFRTQKKQP
jgi:hypothetical protein